MAQHRAWRDCQAAHCNHCRKDLAGMPGGGKSAASANPDLSSFSRAKFLISMIIFLYQHYLLHLQHSLW
jgi:hypothetical protein